MSLPPLVLAAHGSPHPDHAPSILLLRDAIGRRGDVTVGWLDFGEPDLVGAIAEARRQVNDRQGPAELRARRHGPVIIVPLLLAAGFHARVDIPRILLAERRVIVTPTLGPDPKLAHAVVRRLTDVGTPRDDPIVLAAAGSSDDYALAQVEGVAEQLRALRPGIVRTGYLSGEGTDLGAAVRALAAEGDPVTVATYLLSPGTLADKVADVARTAGAHKVTLPLGPAHEVISLIRDRWLAAAPDKSSP
jgi:sirohydrochlorin ferrochelatase